MVDAAAEHDGEGFLNIPTRPGIGIGLKEGAAENVPFTPREVITRLHKDGSVIDQ